MFSIALSETGIERTVLQSTDRNTTCIGSWDIGWRRAIRCTSRISVAEGVSESVRDDALDSFGVNPNSRQAILYSSRSVQPDIGGIVRVQRYRNAGVVEDADRMGGESGHGACSGRCW